MSTTSSRVTRPSLSRSRIWKPSRISRTCDEGSRDSASAVPLLSLSVIVVIVGGGRRPAPPLLLLGWGCGFAAAAIVVAMLEVRVGDSEGLRARGFQLPEVEDGATAAVAEGWSLWGGDASGGCCRWGLVGEGVGVVGDGEEGESGRRKGEAGESGRLKGEVRGEP